jgi:hypothetical protein
MFRQFFLSANGISDMSAHIPGGDTNDLIGREVRLSLVVYSGRDGRQRNKIIAIKPVGGRRQAPTSQSAPTAPAAEPPAVSEEFAATLASLIDGTDTPSAESVEAVREVAAKAVTK